jgi:hypothetical protein
VSTRLQHSRDLAPKSFLVLDVHGDRVRPDMIEGAVLERQGERIRLSELDPLCEPAACSQDASRFDEVGSEVDGRHSATAFGREVARRPAEAAAEIEHVHTGLDARAFPVLTRCHDPAAVQLVERPQVPMAGPLGTNSSGSKRLVDPLYYWPTS